MAAPLAELVDPATTAVITMELQRGVCGDLATMPVLAEAVDRAGVVSATAAVLAAGRAAGVPVVHCTFSMLADRSGTPLNAPLMEMLAKKPGHLLHGSTSCELCAGIESGAADVISNRHHGFSPFSGTDLDRILRSAGATTVVVTGVSLNLGIPGTVIEAVNLGYRVVVVRDCVVGVPAEYGRSVLDNTVSMVATMCTGAELIAAWQR